MAGEWMVDGGCFLAPRFQLPATKKHEEQPMKDGGCVMADGGWRMIRAQ
jgi:hypothetical protein